MLRVCVIDSGMIHIGWIYVYLSVIVDISW